MKEFHLYVAIAAYAFAIYYIARCIVLSIKMKEQYKTSLNSLAQFLELDLEIDVYDNHQGYFVANALHHGESFAQNGEILLLFDDMVPPYLSLDTALIEPIRSLASIWKVSEELDFLQDKDVISAQAPINLEDYIDIIDDDFLLIDEQYNFVFSVSEEEIMKDIENGYIHKAQLLYYLITALKVKKLLTIKKIGIDLNDINIPTLKEKHISITQSFARELQDALLNNNEEQCKVILNLLMNGDE